MADNKMAEENTPDKLQEDLNCGFCLQKLTYMIEPKQLPCSHVFCLPCLEEDAKKDCPVCGRIYDAEWTGMKSYAPKDDTTGEASTAEMKTDHVKCDVCSEQPAVCFCLNCEQTLCDEHYKLHEQSKVFFSTKHLQIDISVYNVNPEKYRPRYCPLHGDRKLTSACYNCRHLFCSACDTKEGVCPSFPRKSSLGNKCHDSASIPTMAAHMRHDLNVKLKEISDKLTEGLNQEKKAWENLHEVESEVSEMMVKIDQVVKETIQSVRENGDKLKEELIDYQKRCTEKVEDSSRELRDTRDKLESLWKSTIDELRKNHDSVVITEYKSNDARIQLAQLTKYQPLEQLSKIRMTRNLLHSDCSGLGISLIEPDKLSLHLMRTVAESEKFCYSVDWIGDQLIMGVQSGVLAYNVRHCREEKISHPDRVHSVKSVGSFAVATLSACGKTRKIRISGLHSLSSGDSVICSFEQDNTDLSHLAVSNKYIATCDVQGHQVIVFNHKGERSFCIGSCQLKRPWGVILCGHHLFVSDSQKGCLYRYKLEADAEPVWVCENIPTASGICEDKDGCLYVASNAHHQIYLVSPEGVLLKTFKCEELSKTETIHDISISEDGETLALACREKGVKLFTITQSDA